MAIYVTAKLFMPMRESTDLVFVRFQLACNMANPSCIIKGKGKPSVTTFSLLMLYCVLCVLVQSNRRQPLLDDKDSPLPCTRKAVHVAISSISLILSKSKQSNFNISSVINYGNII